MKQLQLLLITYIGLFSLCGFVSAKIFNCYYGTWSNYRPDDGKFEPENINPLLCTHISYSFFGITESGEFKNLDKKLDFDMNFITRTMALKQINPKLKVLAVVGGWKEGSEKYSSMAADADKRQTFITSTLDFIRNNSFDGLDLDWEYPAQRGGSPQDKDNFVTLLKELKAAFAPHNLELGIAVGAGAETASISYDILKIAKYVDFINIMTYDLAMANDGKLGFNAPLKGQGLNNVESIITNWLKEGAPASKLILGLATYGRTFQLSNNQQTSPGSPSSEPGLAGPFTREPGYMGYNEICSLVSTWTYKWSAENGVPYIFNSNQWIGYDNVKSIELKMALVNSLNLAGAMIWSLETDDFLGKCGEKYPLLKAINGNLEKQQQGEEDQTISEDTTVATTTSITTVAPSRKTFKTKYGKCSTNGFFGVVSQCSRFYQCVNGIRYNFNCPAGLHFDIDRLICNWPYQAKCKN